MTDLMTDLARPGADGLGGPALADAFKAGFRRQPTGVALVVCPTPDGLVGLTASSVASVSAEPALLSFSVLRSSASGSAIASASRGAVYLLGEQHAELAAAFATRGAERFTADQGWTFPDAADGLPVLADATATFRFAHHQVVPAGQAWLVLAAVSAVDLGPAEDPLVHHDRHFRRIV
ncbi:flavin reductase family protein [Nocardioides sp. YIM 152588]|uniref:flavin reductase family protein n=1 Tax=Nocardioides sp. YIM 152588 TaxID=3158259 RepID=UPI0032E4E486